MHILIEAILIKEEHLASQQRQKSAKAVLYSYILLVALVIMQSTLLFSTRRDALLHDKVWNNTEESPASVTPG